MGESSDALLVIFTMCSTPARAALWITFGSCADTAELTGTTVVTPALASSMLCGTSRSPSGQLHPVSSLGLVASNTSSLQGARMNQPPQDYGYTATRPPSAGKTAP